MKRQTAIALALFFLLAAGDPIFATDGTQWKQLSEPSRTFYVVGVVETWFPIIDMAKVGETEFGKRLSVTEQLLSQLADCIDTRKMRYVQISAIVEKYMNDNPDQWNYDMPHNVYVALTKACKK